MKAALIGKPVHRSDRPSPVRRRWTPAGYAALGLVLPFYFAAITSQSALLLTLAGLVLGCLLVNGTASKEALESVELRIPPRTRWIEGETPVEPWAVINHSRATIADVRVTGGGATLLHVAKLPPSRATHAPPEGREFKRGVYAANDLMVSCTHPFGLMRAERRVEGGGEILVHPRIPANEPPTVSSSEAVLGGRQRGARRVASGTHFAGVRPHQPGDALNQIHWKSTAKGLGLMVKSYEEELSGRVAIILDNRASVPPQRFESALRAAGGLLFAALDAGHQVEWLLVSEPRPRLFNPFTDAGSILDELAKLKQVPSASLQAALHALQLSKRCAIALVLADLDAEASSLNLDQWERRMTVYGPNDAPLDRSGMRAVPFNAAGETP